MEPGSVCEVRIPKTRVGTIAGYFDHPERLIKAVVELNETGLGTYFTINPVNKALLARASNRLKMRMETTTTDKDILGRRWIPIDIDPQRPSQISATDEEHELALDRGRAIRFELSEEGWSQPIFADSGNGGYLFFPVELPNDAASETLIKRVLKALAQRFNDSAVQVDQSLSNASRVVKLFGSIARKGDNVPDRPHRLSRIIDAPSIMQPVPQELLEEFAARLKDPPRAAPSDGRAQGRFNIEDFVARYLKAGAPEPYEGGRRWRIDCPFDESHRSPDAAVFERADGSLAFNCFHHSCTGKGWRDVRELFEGPRQQWQRANENGHQPPHATVADNQAKPETEPSLMPQWPAPLKPAAFCGIVGDFLDLIKPHSEADEAALVAQLLVTMGNLPGRYPYFEAQGTRHYLNLDACLVGATSRGRKGSSFDQVLLPLRAVDPHWCHYCVVSGLSSGEGLIYKVRDAIESKQPIKEKGKVVDYQAVVTDPGVEDKRLLVVEPEFARVLQVIEREKNTLSAVMRQAWDIGNLGNIVRNSELTATNAHISILGHITKAELDRFLADTAVANGFANRFLWLCVKRSQLLPEGGEFDCIDFAPLSRHLTAIVETARRSGPMHRDPSLRDQWAEFYRRCAARGAGMFDAATSRAEPQAMRLACIYARLDQCSTVRKTHLDAGLALWTYSEDSARFIFGDKLGDPTADQIFAALQNAGSQGLARAEINNLFQRHKPEAEIRRALDVLLGLGSIRFEKEETGGRPVTRYFSL
jgi:hypothetical protein